LRLSQQNFSPNLPVKENQLPINRQSHPNLASANPLFETDEELLVFSTESIHAGLRGLPFV
jgi:hypothetical protein